MSIAKSDMIIRGGEEHLSARSDELLYQHPRSRPLRRLGARPTVRRRGAAFCPKNCAKVTEPELIDYCKSKLADYKCPKTVQFVTDIPKGPTGKLLKRELAKQFVAGD